MIFLFYFQFFCGGGPHPPHHPRLGDKVTHGRTVGESCRKTLRYATINFGEIIVEPLR